MEHPNGPAGPHAVHNATRASESLQVAGSRLVPLATSAKAAPGRKPKLINATPIVEASNLAPSLRASVHTRAEATPEERTLRVEGYRANKPTFFCAGLTRHLKILAYVPLTKKAHWQGQPNSAT
jgi:hypothetical protein